MAVLQLDKNLARRRLEIGTSDLIPLMYECDPEIETEISRNRKLFTLPKMIVHGQVN